MFAADGTGAGSWQTIAAPGPGLAGARRGTPGHAWPTWAHISSHEQEIGYDIYVTSVRPIRFVIYNPLRHPTATSYILKMAEHAPQDTSLLAIEHSKRINSTKIFYDSTNMLRNLYKELFFVLRRKLELCKRFRITK